MFPRPSQRLSKAVLWTVGAALLVLAGMPAMAQGEVICPGETSPYLFILLDTSGSLNRAPACSQAEKDAASCSHLCNGPECYVPLQADSPDSKFSQLKAGLYEALSSTEAEGVRFGFATFNQDALYARSKHWLYEAATSGVSIPGWGPFPAAGSRDVLGRLWPCDEGSGNDEVGCVPTNPADLSDAWELERVRMLAKWGDGFPAAVTFYVRQSLAVYRIRYSPVAGGALGSALSLKVRVERCTNVSCSTVTSLGEPTLSFSPVSEYLVWDNDASRTEPIGYFSQSGSTDTSATNTCSGWDPNTDTTADRFNTYSLRWPTVSGDPRGAYFDKGDVIPLDWAADHRQDIQQRLAPNLVLNPLGTPDFRTSPYLRDARAGAETYLRLKNELTRPLIASGSTPQGASLQSFRTWYSGCSSGVCPPGAGWWGVAAAQDPDFYCRRKNLVLITDGEDTCGTANACAMANSLHSMHGIRTYVVAFSADPAVATSINCIAYEGGTGAPFEAHLRSELVQALKDVFVAAGLP